MRWGRAALGAVAAAMGGCLDAPAVSPPEAPLTFVREVFTDTQPPPVECVPAGQCATLTWDVPRARGSRAVVRAAVDAAVDSLLVTALRRAVADTVATTPRALAAAFFAEREDDARRLGAAAPRWFTAEGSIALASDSLVTVALHAEAYTGGAHPASAVWLHTLRRATGDPFPRWELLRDSVAVAAVVERFFRRARGLPPDADLVAAGFAFADGFRLPAQLAVTRDGLRARYNAYEVAPYAGGPTDVLVPLDSLRPFLSAAALAPHRP